ncbi:hypothetical protein Tco_0953461 [Tanacetum coccineum]|uniref:Uncharacterized protein n=1 Tax=Tanacetum coccineum TaxID=301880 RepID=A0ABQ5E2U3_9ASTR
MVPPNNLDPDLAGKLANPKESHLIVVKRISRKSTSGACQILGGKLVCWIAKKQQLVAMSSIEAEYVAAVGCYLHPPIDSSEARPPKEFIIKFSVMNGKKPLTLDYKTFCESTRLDYNKGNYVAHLSLEAVLNGNYSSTKQLNFIQQLLVFSLLTWTRIDIGELVSSGQTAHPQDTEENTQPAVKGFHSPLDEGTSTSKPLLEGKTNDLKDSKGNKQPADMGLLATHPDDGPDHNKGKNSFEVEPNTETLLLTTVSGIQALLDDFEDELKDAKHQSPSPPKDDLESSKSKKTADALDSESSLCSKTFKLYDNYMPITERQLEVQNAVKEDFALNKKVLKAVEAYTMNSTNLTKLLTSVKTFDFPGLITDVDSLNAAVTAQNDHLAKLIGSSSQPNVLVIDITSPVQPESPQVVLRVDRGKGIAKDIDKSPPKLVKASKKVCPDPNTPVLIPYEIQGKMYQFTKEQYQANLDKEDKLEKAAKEARLLEINKFELIKVVHKVVKEAGVDPKALQNLKGGQEFIKKQKSKLNVLNKERMKKLAKAKKLRKKRTDQYRWTTCSRLKLEIIIDIHIHPNTKHVIITVYRDNDRRNFDVHNPFMFGDFWTEGNPKELGINPTPPATRQVLSLTSGIMRKHQKLEPEPENGMFFIDIFGDEAFQRMSDIHKVDVETLLAYLVTTSNINTPTNQRFYAALRSMIDSHPDKEKLNSKKVKLEAVGYSLN